MMRLLLRAIVPLLLPFIIYFAARMLMARRLRQPRGYPWFALTVVGLLLACLSLGVPGGRAGACIAPSLCGTPPGARTGATSGLGARRPMSEARPLAAARWLAAPESRRIMAALEGGGRRARFVGGCVRDTLVDPTLDELDIDIATQEPPERDAGPAGGGAPQGGADRPRARHRHGACGHAQLRDHLASA